MEQNKYLKGLFGNKQYVPPSQKFKDPLREQTKHSSLEDLKPEAIKKALTKKVKKSWVTTTTYGLPIFVICLALAFGMSLANIITLILGSLGLIVFVRYVFPFFFLYDSFKKKRTEEIREEIEQRNAAKRLEVKEKLKELEMQQGAEQFNQILETFNTLIDVLGRKFSVTELAYMKYYVISQSVLEAAMNNLLEITLIKTNLDQGAIDPEELEKRIKYLERSKGGLCKDELNALKERLELYRTQSEKIDRFIAQNEQAITQMIKTTAAISEVDTLDQAGKLKMEEAMAELKDAVMRLDNLNIQNFEDPLSETN